MYDKRVKIFVAVSAAFLLACVLRLAQMQLLRGSSVQSDIEKLKLQRGLSRQLKTLRGQILDRHGKVLAADEPRFQLHISYRLSRYFDERVRRAKLLKAAGKDNGPPRSGNRNPPLSEIQKELEDKLLDLQQIIDKCTYFGLERADIEETIRNINDQIWNLRTFVAWVRNGPDPNIVGKYDHNVNNVPLSEAIADFQKQFPDENQRLLLTSKVDDIAEMDITQPLLQLRTDDDIFAAQVEFLDVNEIQIMPEAQRFYPFGSSAAQTIGWVGPATQEQDKKLFADDKLAEYLAGEVCGRDGVEYVCETILRGKRGELVYDIDRELVSRTQTQFGQDVQITLDIELQQRIENFLANYPHDPSCGPGMAAVVIDVATGDILALVSMPVFDLNSARYDYGTLIRDQSCPLINRAINKQYPPGSVVKPLILIAALESGKVTADGIINCPAEDAPTGWPNCWIYNRYKIGHDSSWQNFARNAIKGSCNIYFSHVADRIDPLVLQQWLFKFGYGHVSSLVPRESWIVNRESNHEPRFTIHKPRTTNHQPRDLRQAPGQISSVPSTLDFQFSISDLRFIIDNWQSEIGNRLARLEARERRLFGMGQGNLRATPLQVANAMAAIARGGIFKQPRLFKEIRNSEDIVLGVSPETLQVIYDGMSAVVNEPGGTAYKEFAHSGLGEQDVKVYGKTGSTEQPDVAWFAGFAEDSEGIPASAGTSLPPQRRGLAIAVVVEGGQHGPSDAAPLARNIIQLCIERGYIGRTSSTTSTR